MKVKSIIDNPDDSYNLILEDDSQVLGARIQGVIEYTKTEGVTIQEIPFKAVEVPPPWLRDLLGADLVDQMLQAIHTPDPHKADESDAAFEAAHGQTHRHSTVASPHRWITKFKFRPSPYPGVQRTEGAGWWYYCTNCRHDYPLDTLMNPDQADCCTNPSLHVWSNEPNDLSKTTV